MTATATIWAALAVALCLAVLPLKAREITLIETDGIDPTDLHSLVRSVTKDCKTDQEKMIALWAFITRRPFYHWCESRQKPEATTELGVVMDPVTAFNVYGTVICYQVAPMLANMGEIAGVRCRMRSVPGHMTMEAFYGGKWHLFDPQYDCAAYYVADDGKTVVSLKELCSDPDRYIRKPRFPSDPFLQFDHYGGKFWPWETKEYLATKFYAPSVPRGSEMHAPYMIRGHRMGLHLRRGETLVRNWANEDKWFCSAELFKRWKRDMTQRWVPKGPHDPRNPKHTYANGELIYEPDWAASEANFLDGLYEGENYELDDGAVRPKAGKAARLVFAVQTPYLIAGHPGKLEVDGDSTDGAIVEADLLRSDEAAANTIEVSVDNGVTWQAVWTNQKSGRRTVRLDLTNQVEGGYGYLLRIGLEGKAELAKLKLRTGLFLSPVLLPTVRPGENRFTFRRGGSDGLRVVRTDLSTADGLSRQFHEVSNLRYSEAYPNHLSPKGAKGHVILKVSAPAGAKLRRMTVYGSFGVSAFRSKEESAEILWAPAPSGPWTRAWKSDFSRRNQKWRWDQSVDIDLGRRARQTCYVKFALRKKRRISLNMARIFAEYVRTNAAGLPPGSVTVTHTWLADGAEKQFVLQPKVGGQPYDFEAAGEKIQNRSVTIAVANDGRQEK